MNILFTICGRAGSRGIKNKNIRNFVGKPLAYYTLSAIDLYCKKNATDTIDIALNTDSDELMQIIEKNPFKPVIILKREEALCGDHVPKIAVILDCLTRMQEKRKKDYDMVVDLDMTSPLLKREDIEHLIQTHRSKKPDVTFSVTESRRNPYFNMVMETERGVTRVIQSEFTARQQAPVIYDMNASMYAYSPEYLKTGKGVLDGYCECIMMEDTAVLDLDHEGDFELMEVIAKYLYTEKIVFGEVYDNIRLEI